MDNIIGHNIKTLLNRRAMKQADVVRRTGMPKSHLSEIVNGHNRHPSVWTCAKIAKALGCRIDDLVRVHAGIHPMTREDADIQHEGWLAFRFGEDCVDHNPYPAGSSNAVMFRIGWAWAAG